MTAIVSVWLFVLLLFLFSFSFLFSEQSVSPTIYPSRQSVPFAVFIRDPLPYSSQRQNVLEHVLVQYTPLEEQLQFAFEKMQKIARRIVRKDMV